MSPVLPRTGVYDHGFASEVQRHHGRSATGNAPGTGPDRSPGALDQSERCAVPHMNGWRMIVFNFAGAVRRGSDR